MSRVKRRRSRLRNAFKWIKGAVRDNLGLKLLCMICALSLVGYQRSQEDVRTRTVAFQLDVQLPPEAKNRELMTTLPPNIKLTVEGRTRALEQLVPATASLALDLRSGTVEQVQFEAKDFDVPPGVRIKFIEPVRLGLEWQDIIEREVAVQSSVTGLVADGFEVSSLTVDPAVVRLRGPANLVQVTQFIRVAPFDVTGLSEGQFRRLLALDPAPDRTGYVGAGSVAVSVEVRRRLISQVFSDVAVEVVGIPGARTTPPEVVVTVIGPPDVVRGVSRKLIVPRVTLPNVDTKHRGSAMAEVAVDLAHVAAEIQPPSVKVTW